VTLRVGVVGGGNFGRGIATAAARAGNDVVLWSRALGRDGSSELRQKLDAHAHSFRSTSDLGALRDTDLLFVAVPSRHVREIARAVGAHLDGSHLIVHVSRGLIGDELRTITRVLREETPVVRLGALAGPLIAEALLEGTPSGAIVGSLFPEVAAAVRTAIAGQSLRIYSTDDVAGVEVASALVGMVALAAGFAMGIGIGPSALAVLCTRGIVEAQRVGAKLGAREKTFVGLAGFGDLVAAVGGDERPEIKLGRALARGASLEEAGREAGAHIEGVTIARRVAAFAAQAHLDAPIAEATAAVLDGKLAPRDAVMLLMSRQVMTE
jgi:glycerol-3-phosphate dehydrogenase (NAD(P)+)